MSQTIRTTWKLYRTHFGEMMLFLLVQVVLRLMVLAPLLFLASGETRLLALLTPVLFVLIVLPARQNAAEAMQRMMDGDPLVTPRLISVENYGQKLLRGLKQAGLLLLWALPWIAATVVVYKAYAGEMDAFTVLRTLMNLGGGDFIMGAVIAVIIYVVCILPFLFGMGFHSWYRHSCALEQGHAISHHRGGLMGIQLFSLLTFVPFVIVTAMVGAGYVSALGDVLSNLGSGSISLPPLDQNIYIIAAAFVALLLPLMPFKQLLPAVYMRSLSLESESATSAEKGVL